MLPPGSLEGLRRRFELLPVPAQGAALALAVLCIEALSPQGIAPFIYFRF